MRIYSFRSTESHRTIKVRAEGFVEAEAEAKEKNFGGAVRFLGAETDEGERWCESCESDECPCPDPDGCHGEGGYYSDSFSPDSGHYETWNKCYECRD